MVLYCTYNAMIISYCIYNAMIIYCIYNVMIIYCLYNAQLMGYRGNIAFYYTPCKILSANMGFWSANIQRYYTVQ